MIHRVISFGLTKKVSLFCNNMCFRCDSKRENAVFVSRSGDKLLCFGWQRNPKHDGHRGLFFRGVLISGFDRSNHKKHTFFFVNKVIAVWRL